MDSVESLFRGSGARTSASHPLEMERQMKTLFSRLVREEKGQDVIEYALLAAAISVVAIPTVPAIGTAVNNAYSGVNTKVQNIPGAS
jgi:Flp pilus assembly pilin Flp